MANFDGNIVVNISLAAAPVTVQNFSTVLIAGTTMESGFTERIRRYANVVESAADDDLSAGLKARLVVAFSQTLKPTEVAVGRLTTPTVDEWTVTTFDPGEIGDKITITILGQDAEFESTSGAEASSVIIAALKITIDALSLPVAITDADPTLEIDGTNTGQALAVSITTTGAATAVETNDMPAVTFLEGLDAILAVDQDWYGTTLESRNAWDILQAARFTEANKRLGLFQTSDANVLTSADDGIMNELTDLGFSKSSVWYKSSDTEYLDVGLFCDRSVVNPDIQSTTFANVNVVGVTADDDNITSTEKANILASNGNLYLTMKSNAVTGDGHVASGEWIDVIIAADWLGARLSEDGAQLVQDYADRGLKIPYTDQGINAFTSLIEARIDQGIAADHFIAGTGDVDPPLLSSISSDVRASRALTIPFSVEPAGAIQFPTFTGYIAIGA